MTVENSTRNRYEVVFNVEGIKIASDPITIDNVVFQEFSLELVEGWWLFPGDSPEVA